MVMRLIVGGRMHLKRLGAIEVQIGGTGRGTAGASAARRRHCERQVVAVHQAHVVVVVAVGAVQCDLRQRRRRIAASARAQQHAPAVARRARPRPRAVEIAPCVKDHHDSPQSAAGHRLQYMTQYGIESMHRNFPPSLPLSHLCAPRTGLPTRPAR